jgi:peptidyl-prolyl cis-trans isomerase SurA
MTRKFLHLAFAVALFNAIFAYAGDVIDRIVAVVNGHIILQSQWDENLAYEALLNHRPPKSFTIEQRKAALDRLIDQELIRQQSRPADFRSASAAEVDRRMSDLRQQYAGVTDDAAWKVMLAQYGLSESDVRENLANELDELRTVDAHLRPGLQIDSRSVESYYREKLLPELRAKGSEQVPLADVAPKIKEILAQQKMNDLLIGWLRSLRNVSSIHTSFITSSSDVGGH